MYIHKTVSNLRTEAVLAVVVPEKWGAMPPTSVSTTYDRVIMFTQINYFSENKKKSTTTNNILPPVTTKLLK